MSVIERLDVDVVLDGLKDFQRDTSHYVFERMYKHDPAAHRFLIADEVGLGKTLVARGVVAQTIDYLWDEVERIDVVYICSNSDIARQNVNRLNVMREEEFALASRITLLPKQIKQLKRRKLNFVSFTPGTSLDLKHAFGKAEERALIFWLLDRAWGGLRSSIAPLKVLSGNSSFEGFKWRVDDTKHWTEDDVDHDLADAFADELERHDRSLAAKGEVGVKDLFEELCDEVRYWREGARLEASVAHDRRELVRDLRSVLATSCVTALEPDLVILDEFQRFKHLLHGDDQASKLARELFDYQEDETGHQCRTLLLSATPYKMYALAGEAADDDHFSDLRDTLRFLYDDPEQATEVVELFGRFRDGMLRLSENGTGQLAELRDQIEEKLRSVMVRTERLAVSQDRDGMLVEPHMSAPKLEPADLSAYRSMQSVARSLEQPDVLEYWKSASYLLNFMDDYQLKRRFTDGVNTKANRALAADLEGAGNTLLSWDVIERYDEIDPGNARLRALADDVVESGLWRLLWLPPSAPYYELGGPYEQFSGNERLTKRLIFSSWAVAPKVIASLISYMAERRMFRESEQRPRNTAAARNRRSQPLVFGLKDGQPAGMSAFGLLYGSAVLAARFDPLARSASGPQDLLDQVAAEIEGLLGEIAAESSIDGPEGDAWYWAGPILLDLQEDRDATVAWLERLQTIDRGEHASDSEQGTRWEDHASRALTLVEEFDAGQVRLGRQPDDLSRVLAERAIAGPGTVPLRALARFWDASDPLVDTQLRAAAFRVSWGLRSLFNVPEVAALVRGLGAEGPYWKQALRYCFDGCLQAVLDEYAHVLVEWLGLVDSAADKRVGDVADQMYVALSLRAGTPRIDEIGLDVSDGLTIQRRQMRTRFAVRFGDEGSEEGTAQTRADQVRSAFNSPFWPFVLASTSIGQEGLDFHLYCHAVVHWNLPSNPVDLEQREGRVHRYKGHAVRKNLARKFGLRDVGLSEDPWEPLFEIGRAERGPNQNDLVPYWVCDY